MSQKIKRQKSCKLSFNSLCRTAARSKLILKLRNWTRTNWATIYFFLFSFLFFLTSKSKLNWTKLNWKIDLKLKSFFFFFPFSLTLNLISVTCYEHYRALNYKVNLYNFSGLNFKSVWNAYTFPFIQYSVDTITVFSTIFSQDQSHEKVTETV